MGSEMCIRDRVYATEVWVNRGGKWRIISYTETLIG